MAVGANTEVNNEQTMEDAPLTKGNDPTDDFSIENEAASSSKSCIKPTLDYNDESEIWHNSDSKQIYSNDEYFFAKNEDKSDNKHVAYLYMMNVNRSDENNQDYTDNKIPPENMFGHQSYDNSFKTLTLQTPALTLNKSLNQKCSAVPINRIPILDFI
jgi:hypothetical protein